MTSNPEYYRLRQQITEHQFGTLKRQWGFTFTLMKGKDNVLSEVNIMMICYNLRRLMSIFNLNDLKNRLKGLFLTFLPIANLFKAMVRWFDLKSMFSSNQKHLKLAPYSY